MMPNRDYSERRPWSIFDNADHWRRRAEECRRVAQTMADRDARRMMLDCADSYERLANRADDRGNRT